jgi:predicted DNA-binding protein (UPF0251 family)
MTSERKGSGETPFNQVNQETERAEAGQDLVQQVWLFWLDATLTSDEYGKKQMLEQRGWQLSEIAQGVRNRLSWLVPNLDSLVGERLKRILTEDQLKVFEKRIAASQPATLESLGWKMGVSKERVRQIGEEAKRRLRRPFSFSVPTIWGEAESLRALAKEQLGVVLKEALAYPREVIEGRNWWGEPPSWLWEAVDQIAKLSQNDRQLKGPLNQISVSRRDLPDFLRETMPPLTSATPATDRGRLLEMFTRKVGAWKRARGWKEKPVSGRDVFATQTSEEISLGISIADLGFPPRLIRALYRSGFRRLGDLSELTPEDLLSLDQVGPKSLEKVMESLKAISPEMPLLVRIQEYLKKTGVSAKGESSAGAGRDTGIYRMENEARHIRIAMGGLRIPMDSWPKFFGSDFFELTRQERQLSIFKAAALVVKNSEIQWPNPMVEKIAKMRFLEVLTQQEIREQLGISWFSLRRYLNQARNIIAAEMKKLVDQLE